MLTLEILGKLEFYAKVFDLDKFRKNKKKYIGWLLSKKKKLTLDRELIRVIKEMNQIDSEIYFYMIKNILYRQKSKLKKIFN